MTIFIAALFAVLPIVTVWLYKVIRVISSTRGQPGYIAIIQPFHEYGYAFFPVSRFNLQVNYMWKTKTDLYRKYNSNVLVIPSLFPPVVTILIADAQAINKINNDHRNFLKDPLSNGSVSRLFGPNIITLEGSEWRRHRKIIVAGFSESNTTEVWDATIDIAGQWMEKMQKEAGNGEVLVKNSESVWAVLALLIMGKAGFGLDLGWPSSLTSPIDSTTSGTNAFYAAAARILKDWVPLTILPSIFLRPYPLTSYLKRVANVRDTFDKEINKLVKKRIEEVKEEAAAGDEKKRDILTLLCRANVLEDAKAKLSDEELIGNAFIFLIAGHETTAGTLASAFAFLALYPSYQTSIYKEASIAFENGSLSYPSTYHSLPFTLAVIYESLRIAGPASTLLRRASADTSIPSKIVTKDGSYQADSSIIVPKGAYMRENVAGVHYSDDWDSPNEFKPERFLKNENSSEQMKSFLPFNSGSRGCIGKQFSLVEAVALLSSVILKYKVEIAPHNKEEWALKENESLNDRHDRFLKPGNFFTLGPTNIDLLFVPRE